LLYIESDLSFTGSFTDEYEGETYTVSVSLKEGWNLYYSQEEVSNSGYKATLTTKVPNGIKWYFESNGNNPGGGGDSGIGNDPSIVVANSVVNANPNIATVRVTANAELGYNLKSSSRMSFGSSKMNLSRTNIKSAMCSVRQFASTGELIADSSNFWR
jgi:hypothetical protein